MARLSILFTASCLLLAAKAAAAPPATELYSLEYAPYIWKDVVHNRTEGILSDLVEELMQRGNQAYVPPAIVPWARGLAKT